MKEDILHNWIIKNYVPIFNMIEPPENFDMEKEIFYTPDYGKTQYGPIKKEDIKKFLKKRRVKI